MRIRNLILEVTRKCNMNCKHCLRGPGQNLIMSKELVNKLFEEVKEVDTITFSGGEPFLNLDIIEYVLEVIKERNVYVGGFYIVTNGKHYESRQIEVCNKWMDYILSNNIGKDEIVNRNINYDLEEIMGYSGLSVSLDVYHEEIPLANYIRYRMLPYYNDQKEYSDKQGINVRAEGNAALYNIGSFYNLSPELYIIADAMDDEKEGLCLENIEIETLYVSSNGNITGDCDMSYEHIDELAVGNILKEKLYDITIREWKEQMAA